MGNFEKSTAEPFGWYLLPTFNEPSREAAKEL
jgi:hypothetical protein